MELKANEQVEFDSSLIELSREALAFNLDFIRRRAGEGVRISSVIKGNAYGHGIGTFLPMAEACGVDHFSVFCAREAYEAHRARSSPETGIMIMGEISDSALEWAVGNGISFYLFEPERLEAAAEAARRAGRPARVHLQIETGMHRIGFEESEFTPLLRRLRNCRDRIEVEGICTHFAGAESASNYLRIQNQKKRFRRAVRRFRKEYGEGLLVHAACSAALFTYPDTIYNMVRVGIAQYGYWPSRETYMLVKREEPRGEPGPLRRLLRWKSRIISVKQVPEGEYVGYGNSHMTTRAERVAAVPVGYSHGFGRNLSNVGYVLVRGERARVIGPVNMNMMTVDVTDIEGARRGDEVVLIGDQGEKEISLVSFGELSNEFNYEVLTRLPERIRRTVI